MKKQWFLLIIFLWLCPLVVQATNVCLCYQNDGGCEPVTIDDVDNCVTDCLGDNTCIAECKLENCPSRCQSDWRETYSGRFDYIYDDPDRENTALDACAVDEAEASAVVADTGTAVSSVTASTSGGIFKGTTSVPFVYPNLNVNIPTVSFSKIVQDGGMISINFMGEYVAGLYKYLLGIASVFAIIMLMVGGVEYIISMDGKNTSKAKERITKALTGTVLLSCVYMMLYLVNPNFIVFKPLTMVSIDPNIYVDGHDNFDTAGSSTTDGVVNIKDVICPKQAGVNTIKEIAESLVGHVAYRFGGKGGPPPYNADTHVTSCGTTPCKDFCPADNICLDCSGFVNFVRACAGLSQNSEGSAGIFASADRITTCTSTTANGQELVPGDFIGWRGADVGKSGSGHVYIYIGDGKVADSHGSGRGVDSNGHGQAVGIYNFSNICQKITSKPYKVFKFK